MPELKFKSLQSAPEKLLLNLLGKAKDGKTTTSLSISAKFDPTFKGPQVLDDIGVITVEPDAMKGPKLMGVEVPYWLDLTDHTQNQKDFDAALSSSVKMMTELVKAGKIQALIFDSLSTLDKTWKAYLSKSYEKWGLIDALLIKHRTFIVEQLMPLGVPLVLITHTKKAGEMDSQKRETLGLDPGDVQVMDITGWDAPAFYRAVCSYTVPVKKTETKGKPDEVNLYPRGVNGIEAGGRYGLGGAPDKMPANLRLFLETIKPAK